MYSDSLDNALKSLRSDNNMLSDSLVEARKTIKFQEKTARTEVRQENKGSLWWLWMLLGGVIVLVVVIMLYRLKKTFLM